MPRSITPTELAARREALGLSQSALADTINVKSTRVSEWNKGNRRIPDGISDELDSLEARLDELVQRIIETVEAYVEGNDGDVPVLITHTSNQAFWSAHPEMRPVPAAVHRVACARAKVALREVGIETSIMSVADTEASRSYV